MYQATADLSTWSERMRLPLEAVYGDSLQAIWTAWNESMVVYLKERKGALWHRPQMHTRLAASDWMWSHDDRPAHMLWLQRLCLYLIKAISPPFTYAIWYSCVHSILTCIQPLTHPGLPCLV